MPIENPTQLLSVGAAAAEFSALGGLPPASAIREYQLLWDYVHPERMRRPGRWRRLVGAFATLFFHAG
ncbi:MAG: hypothetical protein AAGF12_06480 [Myxococcota bacterium]